ncbi:MAG TPA: autoinducer binding domain-containing protein, partial [Caldimonas sp.]|nr:autoinducer binding domain-containing protein [Caldimonas sp.]
MPSSAEPESRPSLEELTAASGYLAGVSAVVRSIGKARDVTRAVELLKDVTARMGAEVSLFASFMPDDASGIPYRLLLNCDPQWCTEYEELTAHAEDPWLAYALTHSEPIRGSELDAHTEEQRGIVQLAHRFGFRSSIIVPTPSSGGLARMGVLFLGSSVPDYFEGDGYLVFKLVARSVAMEFHEWWLARIREELIANAAI